MVGMAIAPTGLRVRGRIALNSRALSRSVPSSRDRHADFDFFPTSGSRSSPATPAMRAGDRHYLLSDAAANVRLHRACDVDCIFFPGRAKVLGPVLAQARANCFRPGGWCCRATAPPRELLARASASMVVLGCCPPRASCLTRWGPKARPWRKPRRHCLKLKQLTDPVQNRHCERSEAIQCEEKQSGCFVASATSQ